MDDPRFRHIASDPRFKRISKKRHKVTVDKRFKSMFTDQKFKLNYHVDKRGKEMSVTSEENLKRFYNLQEDDDNGDDNAETTNNLSDNDGDHTSACDIDGRGLLDDSKDYASDSDVDEEYDSDGSSTDLEYSMSHDNQIEYDWGNPTGDVERSHDTSHRLALCNMNWDRITAQDLFVLLNSFKPQNGVISSVKIYLSDYGRERLAKEEIEGPRELVDDSAPNDELSEGQDFSHEKLRQYQLNRLKYYYAVIDCDSSATAEHLYDQCDGLEYENSASVIDLRFVPSDTVFEYTPHSMATENTVKTDFVPSNFNTTALQQTSVNLTWDETDPSRLKATMKSFNKEELDDIDFDAYLASSSDEESLIKKKNSDKYRALLGINGDTNDIDKKPSEELQITWKLGFDDKKTKKNSKRKLAETDDDDDEDDMGFDDPFFTKLNSGKKRKKDLISQEQKAQNKKDKEELELLLMPDEEDSSKQHFSIKDISAKEKKESAKKKRKKRKLNNDKPNTVTDDFSIDTNDPRFAAMYESHHFAVDPTNPQYRETKAMKEILSEKQKRSASKKAVVKQNDVSGNDTTGISSLVKSVKAKTVSFMERRTKNKKIKGFRNIT